MRKKIIIVAVVATASIGSAGVALAQDNDAPEVSTDPTAQTMSGHSMGRAMSETDVSKMAAGMGMKLDAASVKQMTRMHNDMHKDGAAMRHR